MLLKYLQAARGFAALAVLLFHYSIMLEDERFLGYRVLENYTGKGDLGVDFFFVLSGFIICAAHVQDIGRPGRLRAFIAKRVLRIYPLYLCVTVGLMSLLAIGLGGVKQLPALPEEWLLNLTLIRLDASVPLLAPAWTLVHEMAFYVMFAGLILNRKIGFALMFAWVILCLAHFVFPLPVERGLINTYLSGYNVLFFFGIASYILFSRFALDSGLAISLIGLSVVWLAVASHFAPPGWEGTGYRIVFGVAFAVAIWALSSLERVRGGVVPAFLLLLGDASYSIYLTHELFLSQLSKLAIKHGLFETIGLNVTYFLVVSISVFAGIVIHKFVEFPLTMRLRRRFINQKSLSS